MVVLATDLESLITDHLRGQLDGVPVAQVTLDPADFPMKSERQVLVAYRGSTFGIPQPAQRRQYRVTVYVGSKSLRADDPHQRPLKLLDDVRAALTGLRLDDGAEFFAETEDFYRKTKQNVWWYFIQFTAWGMYQP